MKRRRVIIKLTRQDINDLENGYALDYDFAAMRFRLILEDS